VNIRLVGKTKSFSDDDIGKLRLDVFNGAIDLTFLHQGVKLCTKPI
jgi:hypothetical protein